MSSNLSADARARTEALTRELLDSTESAAGAILNETRSEACRQIQHANRRAQAIAQDVNAIEEAERALSVCAAAFADSAKALRRELKTLAVALKQGERWLDPTAVEGTESQQPDLIDSGPSTAKVAKSEPELPGPNPPPVEGAQSQPLASPGSQTAGEAQPEPQIPTRDNRPTDEVAATANETRPGWDEEADRASAMPPEASAEPFNEGDDYPEPRARAEEDQTLSQFNDPSASEIDDLEFREATEEQYESSASRLRKRRERRDEPQGTRRRRGVFGRIFSAQSKTPTGLGDEVELAPSMHDSSAAIDHQPRHRLDVITIEVGGFLVGIGLALAVVRFFLSQ